MTLKKIASLFLIGISIQLLGQDYHYSQFFNTPITQNPALTGNIKQDYRVMLIHRNQWKAVNAPFTTSSIGGDVNFHKGYGPIDRIGAGLVFTNDELGDGIYKNQYFQISGAAHKYLGFRKMHMVSVGLQTGIIRKNLNNSNFKYEDQYRNAKYVDGSPTAEYYENNRLTKADVNLGLNWAYTISATSKINVGLALFNIISPNESILRKNDFTNIKDGKLPRRYNLYSSYVFKVSDKFSINPLLNFHYQAAVSNINFGSMFGYDIFNVVGNKSMTLSVGGLYRLDDAGVIVGGVRFDKYQVMVSYDITTSNLKKVNDYEPFSTNRGNLGALEVSFIYLGFLNRPLANDLTVPCGFF